MKKFSNILIVCLLGLGIWACNPWDERLTINNDTLSRTLMEEISQRSDLSKFKDLLVSSGYDKIVGSSKLYTVFAPNNTAMDKLDMAALKDTAALNAFMGNHIALQQFAMPTTETRIRLLNGKYASVAKGVFGEAAIVSADSYAANGVLHTIDKFSPVLPNLWSFVNSTVADYAQNKVLTAQNYLAFNPSRAIVDSISGTTGRPVYKPGSGFEQKNQFTDQVFDFADESKQYTYFIMQDNVFAAENTKLAAYFKAADGTSTASAWAVLKDAAVEGYYSIDKLPATLKSKFGVPLAIDKNAITKTIKLSNGIAYVMNKFDVKASDKIQPMVVQGEDFNGLMQGVSSRVLVVRDKYNPLTKSNFKDLSIIAHAVANYWVKYTIPQVPALKYKVYWVALNDNTRNYSTNALPIAVNQKLAMGSLTSTSFAYLAVTNNNFNEVLLGEYTTTTFGNLDIYLVANGTNSMALDYIKIVPAF
jgi:Fasciclin domain